MNRTLVFALVLAAAGIAQRPATPAPGPRMPIRATNSQVNCQIVDGVATVELVLTVANEGARIGEAEWVLPLPEDAVADGFTCRIGSAAPIEGEILDADSARAVYESIVRRQRDPGLLEFAGRGCLRARLFPIPAGGDAEVKIRWRQVLPELCGLVRWRQPVAVMGVNGMPPAQATFAVHVTSSAPIRAVLSPTPGADARVVDPGRAVASFEPGPNEPLPKEFALYYGLSDAAFGLHVLAQRDTETEDGYFTMLISPKRDWDDVETPPRAVTFVLDVSGSMRGEKIAQAKGALRQFLRGLRPADRFDVVPFSIEAEPFFGHTVEATSENVEEALHRVDRIEAGGGTNVESALRRGLPDTGPDGKCVPICVLLSDGMPTIGARDSKALVSVAESLIDERSARIFVLGVGHDLDTVLLDDLAVAGHGTRQYVRPDEDIEEKASDLLMKIGKPVMTDLELTVDGAQLSRMTPATMPDLFAGSRLIVTGRYAKPGHCAVRLKGRVGDVTREYVYEAVLPEKETASDFVPKLWATRRVASLLDEIRRGGPDEELLGEVKRLGVEFQIVTPFTSHLVVEEGLGVSAPSPLSGGVMPGPSGPSTPGGPATGGAAGSSSPGGCYHGPGDVMPPSAGLELREIGERLQQAGVLPKDATPAEIEQLARQVAREMQQSAQDLSSLGGEVSGARAVDDSVYLARLVTSTGATDSFAVDSGGGGRAALTALFARRVGDKVFALREGVWTDRAFDAERKYLDVRKVEAFSDAYFELLRELPALGRYVSLSDRMKLVIGDVLIEISSPPPRESEVRDSTPKRES